MDNPQTICLLMVFSFLLTTTLSSSVHSGTNDNVCMTEECSKTAAEILKDMDTTVSPCDNFYKFVCGKNNVKGWQRRSALASMLQYCFEKTSSEGKNKPYEKAFKLHELCKARTVQNRPVFTFLWDIINGIGGWPLAAEEQWEEQKWENVIVSLSNKGYRAGVFFSGYYIPNFGPNNFIMLTPIGFKFFPSDRYFEVCDNVNYLSGKFTAFSTYNDLHIHFERLPRKQAEENTYETITIAQLESKWPSIDWKIYLTSLFPDTQIEFDEKLRIRVNINYTDQIVKFVKKTPNSDIVNAIIWRIVQAFSEDLKQEIILEGNSDTRVAGQDECAEFVIDKLPSLAFAIVYVNYFDDQLDKDFEKFGKDLKTKMSELLEKASWLNNETLRFYEARLHNLTFKIWDNDVITVNDYIKEYDELELNEASVLRATWSIICFKQNQLMTKGDFDDFPGIDTFPISIIKKIASRVHIANGFYLSSTNRIVIHPAGFTRPMFKNGLPKYINYGGFGRLFGHEISHAFPSWEVWEYYRNPSRLKRMPDQNILDRIQCYIDQYKNFTVEKINMAIDGRRTVGENVADNIGVKLAHMIYEDWLSDNPNELELPNLKYTAMQMFWISHVTYRCEHESFDQLTETVATDVHSPWEFRVIGPLANYPEFAKAFNCPLGSRMNPVHKCTLW